MNRMSGLFPVRESSTAASEEGEREEKPPHREIGWYGHRKTSAGAGSSQLPAVDEHSSSKRGGSRQCSLSAVAVPHCLRQR